MAIEPARERTASAKTIRVRTLIQHTSATAARMGARFSVPCRISRHLVPAARRRQECRRSTQECVRHVYAGIARCPILPPVQRQAVASANTRFFENMFQVNLHRPGPDAQFAGDFLILAALLHQFEHLLLARGQFAARVTVRARRIAKNTILHPAAARRDRPQTGEDGRCPAVFRRIPRAPACRKRRASASVTETPQITMAIPHALARRPRRDRQPFQDRLNSEGFVDNQNIRRDSPLRSPSRGSGNRTLHEFQVRIGAQKVPNPFDRHRLGVANRHSRWRNCHCYACCHLVIGIIDFRVPAFSVSCGLGYFDSHQHTHRPEVSLF